MKTKSIGKLATIEEKSRVNLRRLRLMCGLKQWEVAEGINRSRSLYGGVENGNFKASRAFLLSLREFYQKRNLLLSMDYLCGLSDEYQTLPPRLHQSVKIEELKQEFKELKNHLSTPLYL